MFFHYDMCWYLMNFLLIFDVHTWWIHYLYWCWYLMNSLLVLDVLHHCLYLMFFDYDIVLIDILWLRVHVDTWWFHYLYFMFFLSLLVFCILWLWCYIIEIFWLCVYAHVDTSCTEHQMCVHVYTCACVDISCSLLVYDVDTCVRACMHVHVLIINELITHIWSWYSLIMKLY